jgi:cardiolipin synthase (CMP-forming)
MEQFFLYKQNGEWRLTLPTVLTLIRLVILIPLVVAISNTQWKVALGLFVVAAITDLADGWIARRFNQITMLGTVLDPMADKVLIVSVYAGLASVSTTLFQVPTWFVCVVALKEILLVAGICILYSMRRTRITIKPSLLGKITMFLHVICISAILLCSVNAWNCTVWLPVAIRFLTVCSLMTLYDYMGKR